MKEAMGELNATVVVVIIVAVLSLFFFSYIWPMIRSDFNRSTRCDKAVCVCPEAYKNATTGACEIPEDKHGLIECHMQGDETQKINCPWKG